MAQTGKNPPQKGISAAESARGNKPAALGAHLAPGHFAPQGGSDVLQALLGAAAEESSGGSVIRLAHAQMYQGPLPPAEQMRGYENVCAGAADRIIRMAEETVQCNNSCKLRIVRHNVRFENLGLAAGIGALSAAFGAAVYLAMQGHDWVAGAFLGLAVTGTISHFIPSKQVAEQPKK